MGTQVNSPNAAPPELVELIQFYALRQEPLTLTIESASRQRGWISVVDGDVCRAATSGGKRGVDAFVEIVSWTRPSIVELDAGHHDDVNINVPLPQLLLDTYWRSQEHQPTDPVAEADEPTGLEEITAVGDVEYGPPDGVTREVIEVVRRLTEVSGFIAVVLLACDTGEPVEVFGRHRKIDVPPWLEDMVRSRDESVEQLTMLREDYIDLVMPPIAEETPCYFLRVDRRVTNRALLEVAVRRARKPAPSTD